jgi:hypothetical protein
MFLQDVQVMTDGLVIEAEELGQLVGIIRPVMEGLDDSGPINTAF